MRESTKTGRYLFEEMKAIDDELIEMNKAMAEIEHTVGTSSLSFKVLSDARKELVKGYQKLMDKNYIEVI